jgi:transposase
MQSEVEFGRMLQMHNDGKSDSELASIYGIHGTSAARRIRKYKSVGSIAHRKGAGRPRKTTTKQDRRIVRSITKERFITASEIKKTTRPRKRVRSHNYPQNWRVVDIPIVLGCKKASYKQTNQD